MKNVIVCSDSFGIGIGCVDLNDSYGSLFARHINLNFINYSKGSSSNFSIYLQAIHALYNDSIEYLIIGPTSYSRTEWFSVDSDAVGDQISNFDVNYHSYPPYAPNSYHYTIQSPIDNTNSGKLLTENYMGIIEYVESAMKHKNLSSFYDKYINEGEYRMMLQYNYFKEFYHEGIKKRYDMGLFSMIHSICKTKNIKHVFLNNIVDALPNIRDFIDDKNLVDIDMSYLCQTYPDVYNTYHFSEEAHRIIFNKIVDKFNENSNLF